MNPNSRLNKSNVRRVRQTAFTLAEVLVATAVSVALVLAGLSVYLVSERMMRGRLDRWSRQQGLLHAGESVRRDLAGACRSTESPAAVFSLEPDTRFGPTQTMLRFIAARPAEKDHPLPLVTEAVQYAMERPAADGRPVLRRTASSAARVEARLQTEDFPHVAGFEVRVAGPDGWTNAWREQTLPRSAFIRLQAADGDADIIEIETPIFAAGTWSVASNPSPTRALPLR